MKKEELIKLSNLGLINDESEIETVLDLNEKQINFILNNKTKVNFVYELIKKGVPIDKCEIAVSYVNNINDEIVLKNVSYIVGSENISKSKYYLSIINNVINYKNINLVDIISYIDNKIFKNRVNELIEQLDKLLAIKNESIIQSILTVFEQTLFERILEYEDEDFDIISIVSREFEKRKLTNILKRTSKEDLTEFLKQLPDDIEINSKTYIKIK